MSMNEYQREVRKAVFDLLDNFENKHIRYFVRAALMQAPKYVWTIMASTSGKYHHGELLSEHMLKAYHYGREHVRMLGWWWDKDTVEVFMAALLLHDAYRCGFEDREASYDDGRYMTDYLHPIYAAAALSRLEYNIPLANQPKDTDLGIIYVAKDQKWFKKFQKAVAGHMGPWSPLPELNPMNDNALSLRLHVFLVDYVVSRHNILTVVPELQTGEMSALRNRYYPSVEETE